MESPVGKCFAAVAVRAERASIEPEGGPENRRAHNADPEEITAAVVLLRC